MDWGRERLWNGEESVEVWLDLGGKSVQLSFFLSPSLLSC
jgi:hypothetical protein